MIKKTAAIALLAMTGCSNVDTKSVLDAVQLGPDECGTAELRGNLDVSSGPMGIFTTTVVVNIDKEKPTYIDSAGAVQVCP